MTKTSRTASSQKTASAQGTGAPTPAGGAGKKRSNGGCKLPTYYFTKELRRATGPNQRLSKAAGVGLTRIVEESATALLLSMQIEAGHTVTGDAKRCKPRHQAAVLGDKTASHYEVEGARGSVEGEVGTDKQVIGVGNHHHRVFL